MLPRSPDAIDPAMRQLCQAINAFPGIRTISSCQGHLDGHRPGQPWSVYFRPFPRPTLEAYASLEFLVWMQREASAAGFPDLVVGVNAPPPYLNSVGRSMYVFMQGRIGHPDELAVLIGDLRASLFMPPFPMPATQGT